MKNNKVYIVAILLLYTLITVSLSNCRSDELRLEGTWNVMEIKINDNVYSANQTDIFLNSVQFTNNTANFQFGTEWATFAFGIDSTYQYNLDASQNTLTLTSNDQIKHSIQYDWDGTNLIFTSWSSSLANVVGGGSPINYIKFKKQ
jgi:hypothetical protein